MAYGALTAFLNSECIPPSLYIVTAVLPGGCPLRCPFCIIKQRDERSERPEYTVEHLIEVLKAFARQRLLGGAAVVGDEPLQERSWPYARAFLHQAAGFKVSTALITSGYNLTSFAARVSGLDVTKILVSLDAVGDRHDEIRRTPGAFKRIEEGLSASADLGILDRISLAAILMPGNLANIRDIVFFARKSGVPRLILSPMLQSAKSSPLRVHRKILEDALPTVVKVMEAARDNGVRVLLSDEFGILKEWDAYVAQTGIEVMMPKKRANLIRIDALGRIETLKSMQSGVPTGWRLPQDPSHSGDLVASLFGNASLDVDQAA